MMHVLNDLCTRLTTSISEVNAKKGDITPGEVDSLHKAVETIEAIKKIEKTDLEIRMLESQMYEPTSGRYNDGRSYGNMRDWNPMSWGRDDYDTSGRRGRGSDGRYMSVGDSYRGGDNRSGGESMEYRQRTIARLEKMLAETSNERERMEIREEINRLRMG